MAATSFSQFFLSLIANFAISNIPRDYFIGRSDQITYLLKNLLKPPYHPLFLNRQCRLMGPIGVIVRALFPFVT